MKYKGEWKNGCRHGKGVLYGNYGMEYEGDWKNDKRCGTGVSYFFRYKEYEGGFDSDLYHGRGTLYIYDKFGGVTMTTGIWNHGKMVKKGW